MKLEISEYLKTVCEQIRWKRAHETVQEELEAHIEDQRAALLREGQDEQSATQNAIREMGDALTVGTMLDHTYRPRMDWKVLFIALALLAGGIVLNILFTLVSAGSIVWGAWVPNLLLGLGFFLAALFIDFTFYAKFCIPLFLIMAGLILPPTSFGGLAVTLMPVAFAGVAFFLRKKGYTIFIIIGIFWALAALFRRMDSFFMIPCFFGIVAILAFCIHSGFFKVKKRRAYLILCTIACVITALWIASCVLKYDFIMQNHYDDYYSGLISEKLFSSASFIGPGTYAGQSWFSVAQDTMAPLRPDLALLFIVQECGVLPALLICVCYAAFFIFLYRRCLAQRSMLGRLISFAAITTLVGLFLLNVLVSFIPPLAVLFYAPLPLIASDGRIWTDLILLGVILCTLRTGHIVRDHKLKTATI